MASCKVGPNYTRPPVVVPPTFRAPDPLPTSQAASLANLQWFEVFHDVKLQAGRMDTLHAQYRTP